MTEEKKVLRQAENSVELVGIVNENNLEIKEFKDKQTGKPYNALTGTLNVKVAENENHVVRFFSKELRKDGEQSGQFTGLQTVMDSIVSIADMADNPEVQPTKVKISGSLDLNEYAGQDGMVKSNVQIQGRFVNRLDSDDPTENKAKFDVEGVVQKLISEHDRDGDETGRKKLELVIPLYNKVVPIEFTLEGAGAEYAEDNFENGATVNVVGSIINFFKVTKKTVEMGFGVKEEEKTEFKEERMVESGGVYEEGMHDAKIFDVDLIKEALVKRSVYLEQLKTKGQQSKKDDKPQGFGGATQTPIPKTSTNGTPDMTGFF